MAIRRAVPVDFRAHSLSDSADGSNSFPGAMASLQNLIPAQDTQDLWVCRPAVSQLTNFNGFITPGFVSASLVIGDIEYGMISSGLNVGHDQPYAYNLATGNFLPISGITAGNTPVSPNTVGDWIPPIMALVGTRVVVTHPGFPGGTIKFGWFDISGFADTTHTGNTHSNTTIDNLSANVLQAGWQPGMAISGPGIPVNTTIVSIATGGLSLTLSQAATATAAGVALSVTGGTTATPQWGAGDTNLNNLPSTPVSVAQFNGRAYFACGNGVVWSDSLQACNRTNANQAITFGNGLPVTALGALPLSSPITGGVIQAIIAFQGVSALQQITGDQATTNLATNQMNVATGTYSPLSICPIEEGLAFISPEGLRVISPAGTVSPPIGDSGKGIAVPFLYASNPSRICAAANSDVLRISVYNSLVAGTPLQEYWFDITRKVWSGPHTFPVSLIQPWRNTFILHPPASLQPFLGVTYQSDAQQSAASTFQENGAPMVWVHQTCLLPDNDGACMNAIAQSTIAVAVPTGYGAIAVSMKDESGNLLNSVLITTSNPSYRQQRVPWTAPLVFKQASHIMTGISAAGLKLGDIRASVQELGYLIESDAYVENPFVLDTSALDGGGQLLQ